MATNPTQQSAQEALQRLRVGNARFAANLLSIDALSSIARRGELLTSQSPMAIVLSCSDSRVPSELVFDCGLGDLFVVRVA
jgi:carbonic anhydrase